MFNLTMGIGCAVTIATTEVVGISVLNMNKFLQNKLFTICFSLVYIEIYCSVNKHVINILGTLT